MSQIIVVLSAMSAALFGMMKHPMSMGIVLMMQTVLICFYTNNMAQNPWYSYILFLVFLGGMLVLFVYLTSVASNEMFEGKNYSLTFMWALTTTIILLGSLLMDPMMLVNNSENTKCMKTEELANLTSMFNYPYNLMTTAVIIYLFLTLIVVVKITESHVGPLRSNN